MPKHNGLHGLFNKLAPIHKMESAASWIKRDTSTRMRFSIILHALCTVKRGDTHSDV